MKLISRKNLILYDIFLFCFYFSTVGLFDRQHPPKRIIESSPLHISLKPIAAWSGQLHVTTPRYYRYNITLPSALSSVGVLLRRHTMPTFVQHDIFDRVTARGLAPMDSTQINQYRSFDQFSFHPSAPAKMIPRYRARRNSAITAVRATDNQDIRLNRTKSNLLDNRPASHLFDRQNSISHDRVGYLESLGNFMKDVAWEVTRRNNLSLINSASPKITTRRWRRGTDTGGNIDDFVNPTSGLSLIKSSLDRSDFYYMIREVFYCLK
ncbi:unnamed protein product [Protopolystoma xenopodis]|uniref:Teneurin-1-4-like galactose-binding domain-containing protein n=1 Tax=Protopolystoma xenopodis TaxID=117903 RepID=A0A448WET7_9PLAT|nr:unnamed protein product [Protopolystoma xenopodis]